MNDRDIKHHLIEVGAELYEEMKGKTKAERDALADSLPSRLSCSGSNFSSYDFTLRFNPLELQDAIKKRRLYRPINREADVRPYFEFLHSLGWLFHPEDDPTDIVWGETDDDPSVADIDQMIMRQREMYDLGCWTKDHCPCGIALEVMGMKRGRRTA